MSGALVGRRNARNRMIEAVGGIHNLYVLYQVPLALQAMRKARIGKLTESELTGALSALGRHLKRGDEIGQDHNPSTNVVGNPAVILRQLPCEPVAHDKVPQRAEVQSTPLAMAG